jgi:hypothetical protein
MKNSKNLHLLVSVFLLVPVALVYGLLPDKLLPELFDFTVTTTDQSNMFRGLMGLYLGLGIFWAIGIMKPNLWLAATMTNVFFMGGLATGRLLSCLIDGTPGIALLIGLFVEVLLAFWGIRNLKKYQ